MAAAQDSSASRFKGFFDDDDESLNSLRSKGKGKGKGLESAISMNGKGKRQGSKGTCKKGNLFDDGDEKGWQGFRGTRKVPAKGKAKGTDKVPAKGERV